MSGKITLAVLQLALLGMYLTMLWTSYFNQPLVLGFAKLQMAKELEPMVSPYVATAKTVLSSKAAGKLLPQKQQDFALEQIGKYYADPARYLAAHLTIVDGVVSLEPMV